SHDHHHDDGAAPDHGAAAARSTGRSTATSRPTSRPARRPTAGPVIDVVVVGAGPAGISTALRLHRAGLTVVVVDKAAFPRDKTCGDGLTTLALRELEALGLSP